MALVVLLRGVNVGGHRTFRPSVLAQQMRAYDVTNIGAAGTFVARAPVSQATLRTELARRLPFETEVMICRGADVRRLVGSDPLREESASADVVRFVSMLARQAKAPISLPHCIPESGPWGLRIVGQDGRFAYGVYRREMRAVGHLGQLDRLFGVPVTTRSWNTFLTIARTLDRAGSNE